MKKLLLFMQFFLLLFVFMSCSTDSDSDLYQEGEDIARDAPSGLSTNNVETSEVETILSLINEHRASLSLEALKENETAKQLAQDHAQSMANEEELSIEGNAERKEQLQQEENATAVIELNSRFYSPEELVANWLKEGSSTKRSIEGNYTDVGIAAVKDKNGNLYYTYLMFRVR